MIHLGFKTRFSEKIYSSQLIYRPKRFARRVSGSKFRTQIEHFSQYVIRSYISYTVLVQYQVNYKYKRSQFSLFKSPLRTIVANP